MNDWLQKQCKAAAEEVASWPEWKRKALAQWLVETGKPTAAKGYPVTCDGTII